MNVMQPYHPRWAEFANKLLGPEGCDFKVSSETGKWTWKCRAGNDQSKSRTILEEMGDLDVGLSLRVFAACGGHCDCEVLFNVEDSFDRWFPENPTMEDILVGLSNYDEWLEEILQEGPTICGTRSRKR